MSSLESVYRDIYNHDPVVAAAVDIASMTPWRHPSDKGDVQVPVTQMVAEVLYGLQGPSFAGAVAQVFAKEDRIWASVVQQIMCLSRHKQMHGRRRLRRIRAETRCRYG